MRCSKRWVIVAMSLVVLGAGAWLVWAGPVLPKTAVALPPEVEAMSGLERFRAKGGILLDMPAEIPVDTKQLTELLRQRLTEHGVELGEDDEEDLPVLNLDLNFATDPDLPEAIGVTGVLTLYQEVSIERLGRKLVLPTASVVSVRLTTLDKADQTIDLLIQSAATTFANTLKLAKAQERAARPKADDTKP